MRNILSVIALLALLLLSTATRSLCAEETSPPAAQDASTKAEPPPVAITVARTATPVKIGYVDMAKTTEYPLVKEAMDEMKQKAEQYRLRVVSKQKQLEKQKATIESKMETLSPTERTAKQKEFQKKVEEFKKYVEGAEKDMRGKESALSEKLFSSIGQAAGDYGKAHGFAAILIKKELLYVGNDVDAQDVTDEVMKLVDGKYKVK
ncbi:MAG: OmpH family outer membrane protein [Geobacteraceae bacterium]